jgi:hypothetical protein
VIDFNSTRSTSWLARMGDESDYRLHRVLLVERFPRFGPDAQFLLTVFDLLVNLPMALERIGRSS